MFPDLPIPYLTGVSAGAINAAGLAQLSGDLHSRSRALVSAWRQVELAQVVETGSFHLGRRTTRWMMRLLSGGRRGGPKPRGLLDTAPLETFLKRSLQCEENGRLQGIGRNLAEGRLSAVAITASNYQTGQSVTWVEGEELPSWSRAHRLGVSCPLGIQHIMASAALPGLFPAVLVDGHWYGDGGIRLTAPFAPAVHLGADKILAVSTRQARKPEIDVGIAPYPPPSLLAGVLLDAIFLDQFDADALRLERINGLLAQQGGDLSCGLRPVELLVIRPSVDLGALAQDYELKLPGALRFMTRGLGTREENPAGLLSLLMFEPAYVDTLLQVGERDALACRETLAAFLETTPASASADESGA